MKRHKKKKKRTITRPVLILIIITAVITAIVSQITGGLISSAWRYANNVVWPGKLEISFTECMVYRTNRDEFPTCEMNVLVNNPSDRSLSAELKEVRLFQNNIMHRFASGQHVVRAAANDLYVKHLRFRGRMLHDALKVPQDSTTAMAKLIYEYLERPSTDSVVFRDQDVVKCTYWQLPLFQSKEEALAIGAKVLRVTKVLYWTDPALGAPDSTRLTKTVFTDGQGLRDFDGHTAAEESWNLQVRLSQPSALRRRYGGVYEGYLVSDTAGTPGRRCAHEVLSQAGDYDQYTLIGTTYDRDFSDITEFIHYTFDPSKQNPSFGVHQENSGFYVLLAFEHPDRLDDVLDSLRRQGYGAGAVPANRFPGFLDILAHLAPLERIPDLAEEFNARLDTLNSVVRNDGVFVFFPLDLDYNRSIHILDDVERATGKQHIVGLSFDCRPYRRPLIAAPFSTPILAFLNFSARSMATTLDSIKIEYSLRGD